MNCLGRKICRLGQLLKPAAVNRRARSVVTVR